MANTNRCLDLSRNVDRTSNERREDSSSDALVKLLMSHNIPLDVCKDSHFQDLLKNLSQLGQQASLFLDYSTVIQNSLWKYEDEIKQYMRMVIQSWLTTNCTLMCYNLKGAGNNQLVLGFYCPKGFIFLEGGRSAVEVRKELAALEDLAPDSNHNFLDDALQFVQHDHSYHSECTYQAHAASGIDELNAFESPSSIKCIRQDVHVLWRSICKTSKWIQSLIKKSDKIFDCLITSDLTQVLYNTLKKKGIVYVASRKNVSSFARLRMVMSVRFELRAWLSQLGKEDRFHLQDVTSIINNNEFWDDGNQLVQVLAPFYKVPSLMDTLVPSAGYLGLAIDKASSLLKSYTESEPLKYKQIWKCFKIWRSEDCVKPYEQLACHLNPCYYVLGLDVEEDMAGELLEWLYDLLRPCCDESNKKIDAEIEAYCTDASNPFAGVSEAEFEANHPITLWSKYGGEFPFLQQCAYKVLSQSAGCLCKQVEKCASKIIGSDNFILRLNGLMMEEFVKLGDQIYQPIHI